MKKLLLYFLLFSFFATPALVLAAGLVPCGGYGEPPCQLCHFFVLLKNIYNFVVYTLVPAVAVLIIAWGGFLYIIAFIGADTGGLQRAHDLFKNVFFGLLIIYGAHAFITLLLAIIGWRWGNWWQICPGY
jgi:hypothetical protein